MPLPVPDPEALKVSDNLRAAIAAEIARSGGWMPFARYMELALYAPGLGYYSAGSRKFGSAGDFVTAPEISALFGKALAAQIAQILRLSESCVLEVGAGTGRLAADLLTELEAMNCLPDRYRILELSGDLRQRQEETIALAVPHLRDRIEWLDSLPESICGVLIGNEVLDAMPIEIVCWQAGVPMQRGVAVVGDNTFGWQDSPASGAVRAAAEARAAECRIADGYVLELGLAAAAWLAEIGRRLAHGAILLIDYGFPRREYYHDQRAAGTLMCHYRHHAHDDPFYLPGLQDITAHVDFTAVAESLHAAGLDILGYTAQAPFLMNCGLLEHLSRLEPTSREYIREAAATQKLTSPAEMGELFKVLAAGRGVGDPLIGFARHDRLHAL